MDIVKTQDECENIIDIRAEIDRLDRQVITLLGQRFAYVKAASKFKTSEASVRASERFQAMLQQRRVWAEAEGLNPDRRQMPANDGQNFAVASQLNSLGGFSTKPRSEGMAA